MQKPHMYRLTGIVGSVERGFDKPAPVSLWDAIEELEKIFAGIMPEEGQLIRGTLQCMECGSRHEFEMPFHQSEWEGHTGAKAIAMVLACALNGDMSPKEMMEAYQLARSYELLEAMGILLPPVPLKIEIHVLQSVQARQMLLN